MTGPGRASGAHRSERAKQRAADQVRDEVVTLRAAVALLEARIAALESQVKQLQGGN